MVLGCSVRSFRVLFEKLRDILIDKLSLIQRCSHRLLLQLQLLLLFKRLLPHKLKLDNLLSVCLCLLINL